MMAESTIRMVPALNVAALAKKRAEELLLWYCVRSIDRTGYNILPLNDIIEHLATDYGYARQTAYKHLYAAARAGFLAIRPGRRGLYVSRVNVGRVAKALGAHIPKTERFVDVPLADLPPSRRVQARRALLYNVGAYRPANTVHNAPISRESLETKTGINERQQRRYDAVMEHLHPGASIRLGNRSYRRERGTFKLKKFVRTIFTGALGDRVVRTITLPNTYRGCYDAGSRGILTRARRIAPEQPSERGEAIGSNTTRARIYYPNFQTFLRTHMRGMDEGRTCWYYYRPGRYVLGEVW